MRAAKGRMEWLALVEEEGLAGACAMIWACAEWCGSDGHGLPPWGVGRRKMGLQFAWLCSPGCLCCFCWW